MLEDLEQFNDLENIIFSYTFENQTYVIVIPDFINSVVRAGRNKISKPTHTSDAICKLLFSKKIRSSDLRQSSLLSHVIKSFQSGEITNYFSVKKASHGVYQLIPQSEFVNLFNVINTPAQQVKKTVVLMENTQI